MYYYRESGKVNHQKSYYQSLIKKRMSKNFTYKEQHAVIVKCSSEEEQKKIFEKLNKMGFKDLKVVSV